MRRPAPSVRLRLTLLYGALFLVTGALLLAITYELVAGSVSTDVSGLATFSPGPVRSSGFVVTKVSRALPLPTRFPLHTTPGQSPVGANRGLLGWTKLQHLAATLRSQAQVRIRDQRSAELGALLTRSGIALGLMALVSVGLGWLMAGRALRPVRTMNARARGITERNLHERLALDGPADELKELGDTFDGLLARLQDAFESQRRFVANASHELRTPITVQRTLVEVALGDPDATEASLRTACERVLAVGEQQERLIESLLTLARSQRGLEAPAALDLAVVVSDVLLGVEAADVGIEATLAAAPTEGDPRLVERLVANLVDNALQYNRPDGWIRVSTGLSDGRATLELSNAGPVVADDEVQRLFEPFRRQGGDRSVGPGRVPARRGLGLGLSIVRAIADAHRAELTATSGSQGGLRVRLSFPAVAPEPRALSGAMSPAGGRVRLTA